LGLNLTNRADYLSFNPTCFFRGVIYSADSAGSLSLSNNSFSNSYVLNYGVINMNGGTLVDTGSTYNSNAAEYGGVYYLVNTNATIDNVLIE
jgi:hypothetical protein